MKIDKTSLACVIAAVKHATSELLPVDLHNWAEQALTDLAPADINRERVGDIHALLRDLIKLAESEIDVQHEVWDGSGTDDEECVAMTSGGDSLGEAMRYLQPGGEIVEVTRFCRTVARQAQLKGSDPT